VGAKMIRMKDCVGKKRKYGGNIGQLELLKFNKFTEPMGVDS